MAVVSAGSLCAGHGELPTGAFRQYNILEIDEHFSSVRVHVRTMAVANLFSRGRLMDFGDTSFADLDWEPPRNLMGGKVDTKTARLAVIINEAEMASKTGNSAQTVKLLSSVETPPGSYERQLLISAAYSTENWQVVIERTSHPFTIEELIYRVEAFSRLNKTANALATLDKFANQLNLPEPEAKNLRLRLETQERIHHE
jgi:hypothetical protein